MNFCVRASGEVVPCQGRAPWRRLLFGLGMAGKASASAKIRDLAGTWVFWFGVAVVLSGDVHDGSHGVHWLKVVAGVDSGHMHSAGVISGGRNWLASMLVWLLYTGQWQLVV